MTELIAVTGFAYLLAGIVTYSGVIACDRELDGSALVFVLAILGWPIVFVAMAFWGFFERMGDQ